MILGIDTSCYTSSVAICDSHGRLLSDKRRLLPVSRGQCGLRQSEALFYHVRNLPDLMDELFAEVGDADIQAVAVSGQPRPQADSYMPVFTAGMAVARSVAASLGVPCYVTSHQEGHIMAALYSANLRWTEPFLAVHLSGGTGELLYVEPHAVGFSIRVIGDTDLPPGQFIDRVGVALGLSFPAGPEIEKLAACAISTDFRLTGCVQGTHISFSGPESAAQRAVAAGVPSAEIAAAVLDNIAKSLAKAIGAARSEYGCQRVLLAGGVAANQRIREKLHSLHLNFAQSHYAGDNAVGVALLGLKRHEQETRA